MIEASAPKVFISYSWTNDDHVKWVEDLATRLMADGVDVIFDQWDLKRGHDKYVFMEQMVTDPTVKNVIAICEARYAAKADGREGGVGTESQIISPQIYEKTKQEKFIPIVRERDAEGNPCLPTFFKSRIYIDFSDGLAFEDSYDTLLRDIHDAPAKKRPPIGRRPSHLHDNPAISVRTTSLYLRLKDNIEKQKPFAAAIYDDYLELFLESLDAFRIRVTEHNRLTFDDNVVESIDSFRPYRDEFVDCHLYMQKYAPTSTTDESLFSFFERFASFQNRAESDNGWNSADFDNYKFLARELFLYSVAGCIRLKRYKFAADLISGRYHVANTYRGHDFGYRQADVFNEHIRSLDEYRKQRLKLNWISLTGEIMNTRAPCGRIGFPEIVQTDFLLFIRRHFPGGGPHWYPRCLPYASRQDAFELFSKAWTEEGLKPLAKILGVSTHDQLVDGITSLLADNTLSEMQWNSGFSMPRLTNYKDLCRRVGRTIPNEEY